MYTMNLYNSVVTENKLGGIFCYPWLVRDHDYSKWDIGNREIMQKYIDDTCKVFDQKISLLKNLNAELTIEEENSIRLLFESILQTKKLWQAEHIKKTY